MVLLREEIEGFPSHRSTRVQAVYEVEKLRVNKFVRRPLAVFVLADSAPPAHGCTDTQQTRAEQDQCRGFRNRFVSKRMDTDQIKAITRNVVEKQQVDRRE